MQKAAFGWPFLFAEAHIRRSEATHPSSDGEQPDRPLYRKPKQGALIPAVALNLRKIGAGIEFPTKKLRLTKVSK
jgi:hypothetical protein